MDMNNAWAQVIFDCNTRTNGVTLPSCEWVMNLFHIPTACFVVVPNITMGDSLAVIAAFFDVLVCVRV